MPKLRTCTGDADNLPRFDGHFRTWRVQLRRTCLRTADSGQFEVAAHFAFRRISQSGNTFDLLTTFMQAHLRRRSRLALPIAPAFSLSVDLRDTFRLPHINSDHPATRHYKRSGVFDVLTFSTGTLLLRFRLGFPHPLASLSHRLNACHDRKPKTRPLRPATTATDFRSAAYFLFHQAVTDHRFPDLTMRFVTPVDSRVTGDQ